MNLADMTKAERSCLAYLETCAVDAGGLVEAIRMNEDDFKAVERFQAAGLLSLRRVPSRLILDGETRRNGRDYSHIVAFEAPGWELSAQVRKARAQQRGPLARQVLEMLAEVDEARA